MFYFVPLPFSELVVLILSFVDDCKVILRAFLQTLEMIPPRGPQASSVLELEFCRCSAIKAKIYSTLLLDCFHHVLHKISFQLMS